MRTAVIRALPASDPDGRLGQSPRADVLAGRQLADVFLLLLFGPSKKNMVRAQRSVRRHDDAHRTVHARKFLNRGDVFDVAHARPAVLSRKDRAEQAELAEFLDDGQRKLARLVPLHDVRQRSRARQTRAHSSSVEAVLRSVENPRFLRIEYGRPRQRLDPCTARGNIRLEHSEKPEWKLPLALQQFKILNPRDR